MGLEELIIFLLSTQEASINRLLILFSVFFHISIEHTTVVFNHLSFTLWDESTDNSESSVNLTSANDLRNPENPQLFLQILIV